MQLPSGDVVVREQQSVGTDERARPAVVQPDARQTNMIQPGFIGCEVVLAFELRKRRIIEGPHTLFSRNRRCAEQDKRSGQKWQSELQHDPILNPNELPPGGVVYIGMSVIGRTFLPILLAISSFAQSTPRPEFEVASIRPSAPLGQRQVDFGLHLDGAQVHCVSWSLRDYAGLAYKIKATLISGPDWTASERFDVSATLPAGSAPSQLPEMFQALLADRFQLKLHKEKKEFPVYALIIGKAPLKLKETPPASDTDKDEPKGTVNIAAVGSSAGVGVNLGRGSSYSFANNRFEAKKLTMADFASNLERFADRQIVDMTGLAGHYDFAIDFTPEDYRAMLVRAALNAGVNLPPQALTALDGSSAGALPDALQQLGLKLEARKAPLDVLVIDDALKTPTPN